MNEEVVEASRIVLSASGLTQPSWITVLSAHSYGNTVPLAHEQQLAESRRLYPNPSEGEQQGARKVLWDWICASTGWTLSYFASLCAAFTFLISLIGATVFRSSLIFSSLGLQLVNRRGQLASRLRVTARTASTWLPVLLPAAFGILVRMRTVVAAEHWDLMNYVGFSAHLFYGSTPGPVTAEEALASGLMIVSLLIWLGGTLHTLCHASRSLQDRLAGTLLVPEASVVESRE